MKDGRIILWVPAQERQQIFGDDLERGQVKHKTLIYGHCNYLRPSNREQELPGSCPDREDVKSLIQVKVSIFE